MSVAGNTPAIQAAGTPAAGDHLCLHRGTRVTPVTWALYWIGIGAAALVVLFALLMGWWFPALLAAAFGGLFAFAGKFVLGAGWRPPPPRLPYRTRRPVYRRRR